MERTTDIPICKGGTGGRFYQCASNLFTGDLWAMLLDVRFVIQPALSLFKTHHDQETAKEKSAYTLLGAFGNLMKAQTSNDDSQNYLDQVRHVRPPVYGWNSKTRSIQLKARYDITFSSFRRYFEA
jgi:hypothetical protein